MRRLSVFLSVTAAAAMLTPAPASAAGLRLGLDGGIDVKPDFEACAWVSAPDVRTFVGTFTAIAEMQGPGTRVGTVRYVVPVSASGSWSACIPGSYLGATAGEGKFVLEATSTFGEIFEVKQCAIDRGALTCVG